MLLKNDQHVLPLSDHVRSIALVGPTGNDAMFVSGGSAGVPLVAGQAITPLAGITARAATSRVSVNAVQGSAGDVASPTLVSPSALTPSSGAGPGLLGQYWSNGDFTGAPALTRVDQTIDLGTGTMTPRRHRRWPAGRGRQVDRDAHADRIRGVPIHPGGSRPRHAAHRGADVHAGYREATQFVTGPSYVLRARCGSPPACR